MSFAVRQTAWIVACVILFAGAHLLRLQVDTIRGNTASPQRFAYLPDGEYLRLAVGAYRRVVADLLWLQTIQAMGERTISREAGLWIARALNIVTTLDPTFVRAYEVGGVALCTLVVLPEESNRLLEKGIRHNPESWMLPFLLGFNYYYEMGDDANAAKYFEMASRLPGAPEYLLGFTAHLFISGREPARAVDFLANVYEQATDENLKKFLAVRLEEAIVERDLRGLEAAIREYMARYQRPPERLEDLMTSHLLHSLPLEPSGESYKYDRNTQTVQSSTFKERVRVYGSRRGK